MKDNRNIYLPAGATVTGIRDLTEDIRLFTFKTSRPYVPLPGQFFVVSVFGYGEVPISVTSDPSEPLMLCIKNVGHVTGALHGLRVGDTVGLRGPYGRGFPFEVARDRDVVLMAGGIGIIPLRPVIHELIANPDKYGKVFILYGCRKDEMLFQDEIDRWEASGIEIIYGLRGKMEEGAEVCTRAPHNVERVNTDLAEAAAFICGPHTMIELSMMELSSRGMPDERIIISLEAHMKCGVGKCGHCYIGSKYICTDGPVFSRSEYLYLNSPNRPLPQ